MPREPYQFSKAAEELIGDLRGVPFTEPRKMKRRATCELAPLVQELLAKHHIGQHSPEDSIREHWTEIVGHANAAYARAAYADSGQGSHNRPRGDERPQSRNGQRSDSNEPA